MESHEIVQAFQDEVDGVLADRKFAEAASTGEWVDEPTTYEVNGLTYFRTDRPAFPEAPPDPNNPIRGVSFCEDDREVTIQTRPAASPQDRLWNPTQFVSSRTGIYTPLCMVARELGSAQKLEAALEVAQRPHRSTPARFLLATLSEQGTAAYKLWLLADDARAKELAKLDEDLQRAGGLMPPRGRRRRFLPGRYHPGDASS